MNSIEAELEEVRSKIPALLELKNRISVVEERVRHSRGDSSTNTNDNEGEREPILRLQILEAEFTERFSEEFASQSQQGQTPKRRAKTLLKAVQAEKKRMSTLERTLREQARTIRIAETAQDNFGDAPLVQSHECTDKVWTKIKTLGHELNGQTVLVRGHLHQVHRRKTAVFCLIRSTLYSVKGVAAESKEVSSAMVTYIASLPAESVVDMKGVVSVVDKPVQEATQQAVEIQITDFRCVSKATAALPFQMSDVCRPETVQELDVGSYDEDDEDAADVNGEIRVGPKLRLDHRWLDLRTPANQAIFRIENMVGLLFREYLTKNGFIEIHTPKLIGGASEGGADVFTLDYFGRPACLAMSPQLHKQMAAACSGFERVFEVGPVFRAEKFKTPRHLCEFTGLDLEMVIHEHYNEILHLMAEMFVYIFDGINERCKEELERVREQHPFEDLQYLRPTLRLTFAEGCALLREAGIEQDEYEDLSTENEKKLGEIVKGKFGTDFFIMDKYPLSVRPFYTMPCPENPKLSNSYDFFMRGNEIVSGAQRCHDPSLIEERATAKGMDVADIKDYINSFHHGAMPHGGGGVGLERVVMLVLGLPHVRNTSLFPRTPNRLTP